MVPVNVLRVEVLQQEHYARRVLRQRELEHLALSPYSIASSARPPSPV